MKREARNVLVVGALTVMSVAPVSAARWFDFVPGTIGEVEAAYASNAVDGVTRSYVSSALMMPNARLRLDDSGCKAMPNHLDGGYCVKLAGGGALGAEVVSVKYYWRTANLGHNTPWESCVPGSGCRAFDLKVYPEGRVVSTFRISRTPVDGERDLRMDITFKPRSVASNAVVPTPVDSPARAYERWEKTSNRTGKYN